MVEIWGEEAGEIKINCPRLQVFECNTAASVCAHVEVIKLELVALSFSPITSPMHSSLKIETKS